MKAITYNLNINNIDKRYSKVQSNFEIEQMCSEVAVPNDIFVHIHICFRR